MVSCDDCMSEYKIHILYILDVIFADIVNSMESRDDSVAYAAIKKFQRSDSHGLQRNASQTMQILMHNAVYHHITPVIGMNL